MGLLQVSVDRRSVGSLWQQSYLLHTAVEVILWCWFLYAEHNQQGND